MARITPHAMLPVIRGRVGDLVFRQINGQTFASRRPQFWRPQSTPAQLAAQERFRHAAAYGRGVAGNPDRRATYEATAQRLGRTVYQVAMKDYLNPPVIREIALDAFRGRSGDVISVSAKDDVEVTSVHVVLRVDDAVLERGEAAFYGPDWHYTVRDPVPPEAFLTVEVTAQDRPGNQTTRAVSSAPAERNPA